MIAHKERIDDVERKAQNLSFTISDALTMRPGSATKIRKTPWTASKRPQSGRVQSPLMKRKRERPNSSYTFNQGSDSDIQEIKHFGQRAK